MEDASEYLGYFSLKYQRLTYEYLVAVLVSFAYLMMIIYTILNNIQMEMYMRVGLLMANLFAIMLFNIGMRRAYIDSITEMEKRMSELMNVYYPGVGNDLKEFGLTVRELVKIISGVGKEKKK